MRAPLLVALLFLIRAAHSNESDIVGTARALDEAAALLSNDATRNLVRHRALMLVALAEDDCLIPAIPLPKSDIDPLSSLLLSRETTSAARSAATAHLAPTDSLVFDGRRLAGGNFRDTDAIIGANGSPVALDRELPILIVPLSELQAAAIESVADPIDGDLAARLDEVFGAHVSPSFIADGVATRPYEGRIDDLYFHLVQQGSHPAILDFYGLSESLSGRGYHPVTGLAAGRDLPPARFSAGNVLSGGALGALERFRDEHPGVLARNPFSNFALRVLPHLDATARSGATGSELRVSRDVIQRALSDPRRFVAPAVPPLFQDRSRFLGMLNRGVIPVASHSGGLDEQIAEVEEETELPENPSALVANDLLGTPATNEWIDANSISPDTPAFDADVEPSPEDANPPFMVEDDEELPPDEMQVVEADELPPLEDSTEEPRVERAIATAPLQEPADEAPMPTPAPPPRFHVALLTPTANQAKAYVDAIAANDRQLAENAAALNRTLCYRRWLKEALSPFEKWLAESNSADAASQEQIRATVEMAGKELTALANRCTELQRERLDALDVRGKLRRELEERVRREGSERLKQLTATQAA